MQQRKIAIQGIKGSFHHEAANYIFGKEISLDECPSFEQVIDHTSNGAVDYGMMAIENSLAGCIIPNYNLVRRSDLEICGEVGIRVKLNLLGHSETKPEDLKEIRSHHMALRQCGSFLENFKYKVVSSYDTAGSAKEIADQELKHVGAIASKLAAKEYGLQILEEGIEDHLLNYTRFLVLKRKEQEPITSGQNKLSIYFQTEHSPGSLARLLTDISDKGINLSKLQSHPVPSKNTHYGFFATLEISDLKQVGEIEEIMKSNTIIYEMLGVYKKGETYG